MARMSYGDGVTTVELGGPQERGVLWTGHKDHGVGCWDLVTGAHLMTLSGGVVGTLGGPNAEEMIRPTLGGCWVEEPECWARAFGMKAAGGDMWRKGGSLAMVTFADWGGEDVDEYSAAVGGYGFVEYGNGAAVDVVDESDDEQEPENIVTFGGGDGDGYAGEFVVWDFDAARRLARSHSISAGWRRRTRVRPIARLRLKPLLPNDEVAAFTAAHPMLMVLTTSGTFDCVNLETGATVARVFGLGAAPEKGAKEVGSGSRGDGGGNGDTGAASACGMDVNGYGFIEDQDDDERLTSACSSVTSQPLDDGGGDVAVGAQSAFGIHGIVKAPSGGGVWVLLGSGIVKLRV
ncbi:hypothetical protein HK101_011131 [Irineochytrium annulatum]|nr:hypothetical protein HK101_011131 [Irineochytrium annulatum]